MNKNRIWKTLAIIIIVSFVSIFLFSAFYNKTTTTTISQADILQTILLCNRDYQKDDDLFLTENPQNLNIEIKTIFKNDTPSEMSLSYSSNYDTTDLASSAENAIHTEYNLYLTNKQIDISSFSPGYNVIDDKINIIFYAKIQDQRNILHESSKIFYLPEYTDIASLSLNNLKKQYTNIGFSCAEE